MGFCLAPIWSGAFNPERTCRAASLDNPQAQYPVVLLPALRVIPTIVRARGSPCASDLGRCSPLSPSALLQSPVIRPRPNLTPRDKSRSSFPSLPPRPPPPLAPPLP